VSKLAQQIEAARREYAAALGTDRERAARSELIRIVDAAIEQERREPSACVADGECR
jgi:hypothetical protein